MATANMVKRRAPVSPPGECFRLKIASVSVCVSPGTLETKVIVGPNSPSARANTKTQPESIPDVIKGREIVRNTHRREAPKMSAAASSRRLMASSDRRIERTVSVNAIMAAATEAPFSVNAIEIPNFFVDPASFETGTSEQDVHISHHNGWSAQRQINQSIEE